LVVVAMKARILTVLFCALLLTGCPPPRRLTIYNNTGQELIVNTVGKKVEWSRASTIEISDKGPLRWNDIQWVADPSGGTFPTLEIEFAQARALQYRLAGTTVPDDYLDKSTGEVRMRFQLQPDLKLYAVRPNVSFPVEVGAPQPPGFPIEPMEQKSAHDA
jgi:hypothetical protein